MGQGLACECCGSAQERLGIQSYTFLAEEQPTPLVIEPEAGARSAPAASPVLSKGRASDPTECDTASGSSHVFSFGSGAAVQCNNDGQARQSFDGRCVSESRFAQEILDVQSCTSLAEEQPAQFERKQARVRSASVTLPVSARSRAPDPVDREIEVAARTRSAPFALPVRARRRPPEPLTLDIDNEPSISSHQARKSFDSCCDSDAGFEQDRLGTQNCPCLEEEPAHFKQEFPRALSAPITSPVLSKKTVSDPKRRVSDPINRGIKAAARTRNAPLSLPVPARRKNPEPIMLDIEDDVSVSSHQPRDSFDSCCGSNSHIVQERFGVQICTSFAEEEPAQLKQELPRTLSAPDRKMRGSDPIDCGIGIAPRTRSAPLALPVRARRRPPEPLKLDIADDASVSSHQAKKSFDSCGDSDAGLAQERLSVQSHTSFAEEMPAQLKQDLVQDRSSQVTSTRFSRRRVPELDIEDDARQSSDESTYSSESPPACISLDPMLRPLAVERTRRIDDHVLHKLTQNCSVPLKIVERAVFLAHKLADNKGHHGLLLALGNWKPEHDIDWCRKHVRLMGFDSQPPEELQDQLARRSIFHSEVEHYFENLVVHETDHDGAVGLSRHGFMLFPRLRFEALPAMQHEQVPEEWGCRRITAQQVAFAIDGVCIALSEETRGLSVHTSSVVFIEDEIGSSCLSYTGTVQSEDAAITHVEMASPKYHQALPTLGENEEMLESVDNLDRTPAQKSSHSLFYSYESSTSGTPRPSGTPTMTALEPVARHSLGSPFRRTGRMESASLDGDRIRIFRKARSDGKEAEFSKEAFEYLSADISSWQLREASAKLLRRVPLEQLLALDLGRIPCEHVESQILADWLCRELGLEVYREALGCKSVREHAELNISIMEYVDSCLFPALDGHAAGINGVVISEQGLLCSGSSDQSVLVWDVVTYRCECRLEGHSAAVTCLALDQEFLCSGDEEGHILVWSAPMRPFKSTDMKNVCLLSDHQRSILALAFSGGKLRMLCSSSEDMSVRLWSVHDNVCSVHIPQSSTPQCLAVDANGCVYIGAADGSIAVWAISSKAKVHTIHDIGEDGVTAVVYNDEGSNLFAGYSNSKIEIWDTSNGHKGTLQAHSGAVRAMSVDEDFLYSASDDGSIYRWDLHTQQLDKVIAEHLDMLWCMCRLDPKLLAVGAYDARIHLVDLCGGRFENSPTLQEFALRRLGHGEALESEIALGRRQLTRVATPVVRSASSKCFGRGPLTEDTQKPEELLVSEETQNVEPQLAEEVRNA